MYVNEEGMSFPVFLQLHPFALPVSLRSRVFLGRDLVFPNILFHKVFQSPLQKGSKTTSSHMFESIALLSLRPKAMPVPSMVLLYVGFDNKVPDAFLSD